MIAYVVGHNPDDRIINRACDLIKNGKLVCFPLDTNWAIVTTPYLPDALEKIYKIRNLLPNKHLSLLCENFQKASELAMIDDGAYSLIKKVIPGPYTFIFSSSKKVRKALKASKTDHEVGIRFPENHLCKKILQELDDSLICTHLSLDMFETLEPGTEIYSALIEDEFSNQIDLIIDTGEYEFVGPTSIIDFSKGSPEIIRVGSGPVELFVS
jgi:tRNA threonylcarbamoyl adenosine modification protein (Sua5/YciO/YrdC/YwlC family)